MLGVPWCTGGMIQAASVCHGVECDGEGMGSREVGVGDFDSAGQGTMGVWP